MIEVAMLCMLLFGVLSGMWTGFQIGYSKGTEDFEDSMDDYVLAMMDKSEALGYDKGHKDGRHDAGWLPWPPSLYDQDAEGS